MWTNMLMLHSEGTILHNSAFVLLVLLLRCLFFFFQLYFFIIVLFHFWISCLCSFCHAEYSCQTMSSYVCFCWFISVNGHDLCFFSSCFPFITTPTCCPGSVCFGGAEVSMLITKTNRLLPLSEEGMSLRVVSSLQHKPVGGSNTWFLFIVTHGCYSRSVYVLLPRLHVSQMKQPPWGNQHCFPLRAHFSKRKCRCFSSASVLLTRSVAFLCDLQAEVIKLWADYWLAAPFPSSCGCKRTAADLSFAPLCIGWDAPCG